MHGRGVFTSDISALLVYQVGRYDTIMEDLKRIVGEVEPPYIDAERITERYGELQDQMFELSEFAEAYQQDAAESLEQVGVGVGVFVFCLGAFCRL